MQNSIIRKIDAKNRFVVFIGFSFSEVLRKSPAPDQVRSCRKSRINTILAGDYKAQIKRISLMWLRKLGKIIKGLKANGEISHGGDRKSVKSSSNGSNLKDLGVTKNLASQAQKIAELPEETFQKELKKTPSKKKLLATAKKNAVEEKKFQYHPYPIRIVTSNTTHVSLLPACITPTLLGL